MVCAKKRSILFRSSWLTINILENNVHESEQILCDYFDPCPLDLINGDLCCQLMSWMRKKWENSGLYS